MGLCITVLIQTNVFNGETKMILAYGTFVSMQTGTIHR
jgi:hypothetical protein